MSSNKMCTKPGSSVVTISSYCNHKLLFSVLRLPVLLYLLRLLVHLTMLKSLMAAQQPLLKAKSSRKKEPFGAVWLTFNSTLLPRRR